MNKKEFLGLLERKEIKYKVESEGGNFIIITTNDKVFGIISVVLAKSGISGEGRSGGGIESYQLHENRLLNVAFPFQGKTTIYLGPKSYAF